MNLLIASKGGFCFGVKKAVDTAIQAANDAKGTNIYTYGPIIHNSHIVDRLDKMGVRVIENLEEAKGQTVIVRSHGVPLDFYERAKEYDIHIIDTTCPFVRKVQHIAKEHEEQGHTVVILGNPNHPEVIGINGWAKNKAIIIQTIEDLNKLSDYKDNKLCIVAQTTLSLNKWDEMTDIILKSNKNIECFNTICSATRERQEECKVIAKKVDYMIVVGGINSSNTQKLYEISKENCKKAVHIESVSQLMMNIIRKYDSIGIVAGASTPNWVINEVIDKLEK